MESPHSMVGLLLLRQFLSACGRLWSIIASSRPWSGFPLLRAFLDLLERLTKAPSPNNIRPALETFLARVEDRCPGAFDALLRAREPDPDRDLDLDTPPEVGG